MQDAIFTGAQRMRALEPDAWSRFARVLDGIGCGIGLWLLIWPQPYKLAILSAMTAFIGALAAKVFSRQRLAITDAKKGDLRPRIQMLVLMPPLALALRAIQDINLVDWKPVLIWSLALAAVLAIPLFGGDSELPKKPFISAFLLFLAGLYAWGSITEANVMFDTSAPRIFQTTIRSMHANRGKSTSYHLLLGPWNGRPAGDDARVSYAFYAKRHPGDPVCVALGNGWLGFRYYEARSCW